MFLRQDSVDFSLDDIQEIDAIVSGIDVSQTREAGPLILAWAVFLCLISSLPPKEDNNESMVHLIAWICKVFIFEYQYKYCKLILGMIFQEMDHVNYVRQAIEAASLSYFVQILESDIWKELDVSFFFML